MSARHVCRGWPVIVALLAALAAVVPAAGAQGESARSPGPYGLRGTWSLAFRDDFGGTSLDRSAWDPDRYGHDYGGDAPFDLGLDDAWFSERNVTVAHGRATLSVRHRPRGFYGRQFDYSSGMIQTVEQRTFRPPAFLEARVALHSCSGCWPAFWTERPDVWPPEIDIFEFFAGRRPYFNYHRPDRSEIGPRPYGSPAVDYRYRFHRYGLFWDGHRAVPYLDGRRYPVGTNVDMTRTPQRLILSLSVLRGGHPAPGSKMIIDWVRVFRRTPSR